MCGGFAGFETSPEGECCTKCGRWVCESCVDWSYMSKINSENPICKDCATPVFTIRQTETREVTYEVQALSEEDALWKLSRGEFLSQSSEPAYTVLKEVSGDQHS